MDLYHNECHLRVYVASAIKEVESLFGDNERLGSNKRSVRQVLRRRESKSGKVSVRDGGHKLATNFKKDFLIVL